MTDKNITVSFATGGIWGKEFSIEIRRHGERWTDHRTTHEYNVTRKSAQRLAKILNLYFLMGNYEMKTHLYFGEDGSSCQTIDVSR